MRFPYPYFPAQSRGFTVGYATIHRTKSDAANPCPPSPHARSRTTAGTGVSASTWSKPPLLLPITPVRAAQAVKHDAGSAADREIVVTVPRRSANGLQDHVAAGEHLRMKPMAGTQNEAVGLLQVCFQLLAQL